MARPQVSSTGIKALEHSKYRRRRLGTPPGRDASCGSQWRCLYFLAFPHQAFQRGSIYRESNVC
jgi:hypothetical protein